VKIRERWVRSLGQLFKLYLRRIFGIHLLATHCAAAERGVLIQKERKKESSSVKLKAFDILKRKKE